MRVCVACGQEFRDGIPFCPHCGARVADGDSAIAQGEAPDPLVGRLLAQKFRVLSVLGAGGMGKVYKAEQVPLGVHVVIKTLHEQLAGDKSIVERFFREAQSASRLRHPNCVSILDFGDDNGTLYIAMEFLRGRPLGDLLAEQGVFSAQRLVRVLSQILDVLEAAHRMSVVHRDLKPDNIMVEDLATTRDFAKVLDFGIAKIIDPLKGDAKLTQTNMVIGTPAYMAPEQATAREVDGRTDLYSIGVIAFELATGRLPFMYSSVARLLAAQVSDDAPPVKSLRKDLPDALARVIDQALKKDPNDRPQTALEFKMALEGALNETAVHMVTSEGPGGGPSVQVPRSGHGDLAAVYPPCPQCGNPLPPQAKFCGECGASSGRQTRSTGLGDRYSDLRRYLPSGIVDELQQARPTGVGEKRDVVAMCVDISTANLRASNSETADEKLAQLYAGLGDIAVRHSGQLERRPDNSGVVMFGLGMTHADDPERAVQAAVELRKLTGELNSDVDQAIQVTIVVHAGSALVQSSAAGNDYTPEGDTLELPTRLAAACDAGTVLITQHVQRLVRDSVKLRRMPAVRLKGRSNAVAVFEVTGLGARTSKTSQLATPPMVGRHDQVEAILRVVDGSTAGNMVHVVGEPGSGKSRFLAELATMLAKRHHVAVHTSARSGTDARSRVVGDIVRGLGGSQDGLRSLGLPNEQVRLLMPYLGDERPSTVLNDAQLANAVVSVLWSALGSLAKRSRVSLLIDDVDHGDRLVSELVSRLTEQPIERVTVICASRPDTALPWAMTPGSDAILSSIMTSLGNGAITDLVAGSLAPTPPPAELIQAVASRAGGSPLMALEVLRSMVDAGLLQMVGGRWTLAGPLDEVARPAGLRPLMSARIDALPAFARNVLACAAAYGEESFPVELIDRILTPSHGEPIAREITLLVSRGLFRTADAPGMMCFAEQITRDVVYDRLTQPARQKLHAALALAIDASPLANECAPELIGKHFARGGIHGKALDWLERAADQALAEANVTRAIAALREAQSVASAAQDGPDARSVGVRLAKNSQRLGQRLLEQGALDEAAAVLAEGVVTAQRLDDARLITELTRSRGLASFAKGQLDASQRDFEAALQAALGLRDPTLLANLHVDLGEVYEKRGDFVKASDYLLRALELAQKGASLDVQACALRALSALGRVSLRSKAVDRALRFFQQGLQLAEELDDQAGAAKVLGNLAGVYHAKGELETASKFVDRSLELARNVGDMVGIARQLNNLGTLRLGMNDAAGAQKFFAEAYQAARRAGWREGMGSAAAGRDRARVAAKATG